MVGSIYSIILSWWVDDNRNNVGAFFRVNDRSRKSVIETGGSLEDNFPKRENNWLFGTLLGIHNYKVFFY